jgi:uncharacterized membrane protein YkvA (DUF1232 family)
MLLVVTDRRPPTKAGLAGVPLIGDVLATWRMFFDARASGWAKLGVVLALVYVVSPIDAIPDAIMPVVAWLDDLGVLVLARVLLSRQLATYRYPLFSPAPVAPTLRERLEP